MGVRTHFVSYLSGKSLSCLHFVRNAQKFIIWSEADTFCSHSTSQMTSNPSTVLDRLERQMRAKRVNLIVSNDTHGDTARHMDEAYDPILARFTNFIPESAARSQPDESLRAPTNFTILEFDTLWGFVESDLAMAWTTGRGRQSFVSPRDAVFMTLTVLKHYDTWQKHAVDFDLGLSSLEKVVHKIMGIIEPVLYKHLVKPVKMSDQVAAGKTFKNYPYAFYGCQVPAGVPPIRPIQRTEGIFFGQAQAVRLQVGVLSRSARRCG
jgi:hypothetical protein